MGKLFTPIFTVFDVALYLLVDFNTPALSKIFTSLIFFAAALAVLFSFGVIVISPLAGFEFTLNELKPGQPDVLTITPCELTIVGVVLHWLLTFAITMLFEIKGNEHGALFWKLRDFFYM